MPYLTLTAKATTKPWLRFSRLPRHPARKRSVSILGQTHTFTYLLTCPGPKRGNGADRDSCHD